MILVEATLETFGYHPGKLALTSQKKVVCFCPRCEQPYTTQRRYYHDGRLCSICTSRQTITSNRNDAARAGIVKHNQQCKEMGLSPKGLPLVGDRKAYMKQYKLANKERGKQQNRDAQRKHRQTLVGRVSNRLRVSLRTYLKGRGGFSQLPYTPTELQTHIKAKLEERKYLCPMCSDSLKEHFDIDHRVPLSGAKTVDEVIALFALSNLDVLCPPCNQYKKGKKHLAY